MLSSFNCKTLTIVCQSSIYITELFCSSRNTTTKVPIKYMSGKWLFSNAVFLKPILWSDQLKKKKKTFQITRIGTFVKQN